MTEPTEEPNKQLENPALDLSSLSSMSLGPNWGSGDKPASRTPKVRDRDGDRGKPRHDNRKGPPRKRVDRSVARSRSNDNPRGGRSQSEQRYSRQEYKPFEPIVSVEFYPEEEPFKVLSHAIRSSCRTYELFEIARLILDKPDRWVCVVRDPKQAEGSDALLYASVPDGLPFRSEEEVLNHVFRHHLDAFFTTEQIEVEPPKGSFQMVHKCGFTGEILGPPNFHRYQSLCRTHHSERLAHMPYSRFEEKIESIKDEEAISGWMEKMKVQTRYHSKSDEGVSYDTAEDARLYLLAKDKEKLVRPAYSTRFSGKALALLNQGDPIRRSIEYLLEGQRRFPLDTANHLRGRLRRLNFSVYKKGSKGVSYVCGVKRRFRSPGEVLADNLQELIEFIEAHPNFPAKELPKTYLGIDLSKAESASSAQVDPETMKAAQEMATSAGESVASGDVETEKSDTNPPVPPSSGISADQEKAILELKRDLKYLVTEGYVTEFSDGKLFVPPIREEDIRRHEKKAAKKAEQPENPVVEPENPVVETAVEVESLQQEASEPEPTVVEESATEPEPVSAEPNPEELPEAEAKSEEPPPAADKE